MISAENINFNKLSIWSYMFIVSVASLVCSAYLFIFKDSANYTAAIIHSIWFASSLFAVGGTFALVKHSQSHRMKVLNTDKNIQKVTQCSECGSKNLKWHCGQKKLSGVQDGLLRMHDVETEFCLGCEACSETLQVVSGDRVAEHLNNGM